MFIAGPTRGAAADTDLHHATAASCESLTGEDPIEDDTFTELTNDGGALSEPGTMRMVRRALLALLVVFMLGTGTDLMLLDHHEGAWQLVPLALLAAGLLVAAWSVRGGVGAVTTMRILMVLFVAAGFMGIVLHSLGNREFQLEMDPAAGGWPLFWKVVTAKSPPALAPASMIMMGLLGLIYTYQHPALRRIADR
jgi:hypothetical protein